MQSSEKMRCLNWLTSSIVLLLLVIMNSNFGFHLGKLNWLLALCSVLLCVYVMFTAYRYWHTQSGRVKNENTTRATLDFLKWFATYSFTSALFLFTALYSVVS